MDTTTWDRIDAIGAHTGPVTDLALSADGVSLASARADDFVRVWDVAGRTLVTEVGFDTEIAAIEFIDDAHLLVVPSLGDEAIVVTLDTEELLEVARSRLTRSFTSTECDRFGIDDC